MTWEIIRGATKSDIRIWKFPEMTETRTIEIAEDALSSYSYAHPRGVLVIEVKESQETLRLWPFEEGEAEELAVWSKEENQKYFSAEGIINFLETTGLNGYGASGP